MTNQKSTFIVPISVRISAKVDDVIALAVSKKYNPEIPRNSRTDILQGFTLNYADDHTVLVAGTGVTVDRARVYEASFAAEVCCNNWTASWP